MLDVAGPTNAGLASKSLKRSRRVGIGPAYLHRRDLTDGSAMTQQHCAQKVATDPWPADGVADNRLGGSIARDNAPVVRKTTVGSLSRRSHSTTAVRRAGARCLK